MTCDRRRWTHQSEQQYSIRIRVFWNAFQQCEGSGFTDGDAVALCIKRATGLFGNQAERIETIQRRQTQRIHATHHRRVDQSAASMRRAEENTLALDEHADDTTTAGPVSPK